MATTVEGAFESFYDAINLSGNYRDTANKRKDNVVEKLKEKFEILDAFATGSIPKFTALKDTADVDVFVVLHYGKHIKDKTPSKLLELVRDSLSEFRTNVRRNGQAVTLYYKTWPNVDIVPVSRTPNDDGTVNHYNVPNANDNSWIEARPRKFASEIDGKAAECGRNFRRIIKMIKHWNNIHGGYLSGYHIEVLALKCLFGNLDDTPWNVYNFFDSARKLLDTPLWHELGWVDNYLSAGDRQEISKRMDTAINTSRNAWHNTYATENNHQMGIKLWKQMFGDKFPTYG